MNSIFGMFMESWMLRVSCKVTVKSEEGLHVNFARDPKYSWFHEPSKKLNLLHIFTFYYKYLIYIEIIYNLGDKTILYLIFNRINGFVGVQNGKACNSGVARCQSQHQCHIWRMNSMLEAYCTGKWAWQLSIKFLSFMKLWTVARI